MTIDLDMLLPQDRYEVALSQDSRRDAQRYYQLLNALKHATEVIGVLEREGTVDIDQALSRLLPDLANAVEGQQAFIAKLQDDPSSGQRWLSVLAAYPQKGLSGHILECAGVIKEAVTSKRHRVVQPLGEEHPAFIPGLELFEATSAILVPLETLGRLYAVCVCNKANPQDLFLAADALALGSIIELIAMGARMGERRRQELQSIQKTSAAISAELDLEELLPMIADKAAEVFAAPTSLMLWDTTSSHLEIVASQGLSAEYVWCQHIPREKVDAALDSIGDSQSLVTTDLRHGPFGELDLIEGERLCSVLSTKLLVSGQLIGILNIYSKDTPRDFTLHERELAETLANQAAIAIENARLRARELTSLLTTSDAVKAALDIDSLLQLIATKTAEAFNAPATSLMLWDESLENMIIKASEGLSAEYARQQRIRASAVIEALASAETKASSKGSEPRPWVTLDLQLAAYGDPGLCEQEDLYTALSAPLIESRELIGILNIYSKHGPRDFTPNEIELAEIFANQAAITIRAAQLHHQTEQRGEQLAALEQIALDIASRLETKELLRTIVGEATDLVQGAGGGVYLWDEENQAFQLEAVSRLSPDLEGTRIEEKGLGIISQVLHKKQPIAVADYQNWPGRLPLYDHRNFSAVVGAPILSGDRFLGVIAVHDTREGRVFGKAEQQLLLRFAYHAAIALENAQIFADLHRIDIELEIVLGTINTVAHTHSLDEGLDALAKSMVKGLGATFSHIVLLDETGQALTVEAAYPLPRPNDPALRWKPGLGRKVSLQDFSPMRRFLQLPEPRVYRPGDIVENRDVLVHIRTILGWEKGLESVLVVPLKVGGETFGFCTLGETCSWEQSPFTQDRVRLANSMASQAAVLIDRLRAHEVTERNLAEMRRLREIGEELVGAVSDSPKGILNKVAQAACEVVGADCAVIYPWDKERQSYDTSNIAQFGLRRATSHSDWAQYEEGNMTSVVLFRGALTVDRVSSGQDRTGEISIPGKQGGFIDVEGIEAFVGISLQVSQEPVGALFVNFRKPHYFTGGELETIIMLANQAAVAIQQSRLFQQVNEEGTRLRLSLLNVGRSLSELRNLEDTLRAVANGIQQVLDCDIVTVYSYDVEGGLFPHRAVVVGELQVPGKMGGHGLQLKSKIFNALLQTQDPQFADNALKNGIMNAGGFVKREKIRSSAGAPLWVRGQPVGLLFVNYRRKHRFSEIEKEAVRIFASQAAIAIHNAKLYDKTRRQSEHRQALVEASAAITAGFTAERKLVLDRIAEQAVSHFKDAPGAWAQWGAIMLYDQVARELVCESVWPQALPDLTITPGERWSLDRDQAPDSKIGIAGRAILEAKPQRVGDVLTDPDYRKFHPTSQSQLVVLLRDGSKIIGVLSVESDKEAAFDADDQQALQGLAELAVLAIMKADQTAQLVRTNTLAIMGAWGAEIQHDVNRELGAIRRATHILRQDASLANEAEDRLTGIDRHAAALELPELPERKPEPGHAVELADAPFLEEVIRAELQRLQIAVPSVSLHEDLNCPAVRVAMHEQWLRRLLRHVLYNAIDAIPPSKETRTAIVRAAVMDSMAEIQVEDTGDGVPPHIEPLLFHQPVPRENGRQGRGLLLVRFIAEQYGGSVELVWSLQGQGSCFALKIPLAR